MAVYSTALVTGASSGIGEQLARALAARGTNLVLVARSVDRLEWLARELREAYPGLEVTAFTADLANPAGADAVLTELSQRGITIDLLVNNAGIGTHNRFVDEQPAAVVREIQLNCTSLVALTSGLLPSMVQRRHGGVVNVASTAAFQPIPTMAVYAASKAFVLSFTEALWAENRSTGVRVLALCPGSTATRFFEAAGKEFLTRGRQTPEQVARVAIHALLNKQGPTVISGAGNLIRSSGYRFLPRAFIARMAERVVHTN